jgi:hypothetical protein
MSTSIASTSPPGSGKKSLKCGDIINSVAQHMTEGAHFDGITGTEPVSRALKLA